MILVDEGHHAAAESWQKVFRRFPDAKVVSLTATPFRSDQLALEGEVIYRYPFSRAMMKGFIKQIHSRNVAPAELYFTYRDDTKTHTLDEVLELREEQWFRRGVALSPECNRHIAEASIQRCNELRAQTGIQHQIIAAACSIDHARQVRAIYEECGYSAAEIHSEMAEDERDAIIERLRVGQARLHRAGADARRRLRPSAAERRGDLPAVPEPLALTSSSSGASCASLCRTSPSIPTTKAFIVSHIGLNNDARWDEFRDLDLEDQLLIHGWVTGEDETDEPDADEGHGVPRRFDLVHLVDNELISHFIDRAFLDPDDNRVLDEMLAAVKVGPLTLGDLIDRETLRQRLRESQEKLAAEPTPIPVSPQRRRRTARTRLRERTGSVVARILKDTGVSRQGREVAKAIPGAGPMSSNVQYVTRLLNREINDYLDIKSKQRGELSSEQAERALDELDQLGDHVRDRIIEALNGGSDA